MNRLTIVFTCAAISTGIVGWYVASCILAAVAVARVLEDLYD